MAKAKNIKTKATKHAESRKEGMFEYDEVPYDSHPFFFTYPAHLKAIGKMFGMKPPKLETARVLELGCSEGANAVLFAQEYPKSEVVAIDLSEEEIRIGKEKLNGFEIKNLDLKVANIMDIDESWGKFDYIICHGVWSWVPEVVREKILELSSKNLSKEGIAFISYNTKPGWNAGNTIRDMMIYHSSFFSSTTEKISQAKAFLNFTTEVLEGNNSPFATYIRQETEGLKSKHDSYIFGEYLVGTNHQVYFKDFLEQARKHDLTYLADTHLPTMYIGNMPKKVVESIGVIDNIERLEQYMDFINNRRFRCTLLTHNTSPINRNLNLDSVKDLHFYIYLVADKPMSDVDITDISETLIFYTSNNKEGSSLKTSSAIMKAILYVFSNNSNTPMSIDEIAAAAYKKLNDKKLQLSDIKKEFLQNIYQFIFTGNMHIYADKPHHINVISEKPKVSDLARHQIQHTKSWVTTQLNNMVSLDALAYKALHMLDGTNTKADIIEYILE